MGQSPWILGLLELPLTNAPKPCADLDLRHPPRQCSSFPPTVLTPPRPHLSLPSWFKNTHLFWATTFEKHTMFILLYVEKFLGSEEYVPIFLF